MKKVILDAMFWTDFTGTMAEIKKTGDMAIIWTRNDGGLNQKNCRMSVIK